MFQAPKLTDAGKNLYYRNMAGEGIKFTTIQLGNGTISGPISAMTALVSAVVTIDAAVKNNAEQYADVSGHFSTQNWRRFLLARDRRVCGGSRLPQ